MPIVVASLLRSSSVRTHPLLNVENQYGLWLLIARLTGRGTLSRIASHLEILDIATHLALPAQALLLGSILDTDIILGTLIVVVPTEVVAVVAVIIRLTSINVVFALAQIAMTQLSQLNNTRWLSATHSGSRLSVGIRQMNLSQAALHIQ